LRRLGFTVRIKIGRYEMVSSSLLGLLLLLVVILHVLLVKEKKSMHIKCKEQIVIVSPVS
jgi:hypothetical protein